MLSRIRPLYVLIAGPALLLIISAVCYFVIVRPQYNVANEGTLAWLTQQADTYEQRAAERSKWESEKDKAERQLRLAQKLYAEVAKTKTLPLSSAQYHEYLLRLWFLHLEDFPKLTRQFLSKAPCEVAPRELQLGPPPMPPPPMPGGDGFLPLGSTYTLTATGTLEQIWQFVRSLPSFPNCVVRLNSVDLVGLSDGTITATLPIQMWMIVEHAGPGYRPTGVTMIRRGGDDDEDEEEEEEEDEDEDEDEEEEEEDD